MTLEAVTGYGEGPYHAIVVGGASGIGAATAALLQGLGVEVSVIDRQPARPDSLAARHLISDVTDAPGLTGAIREAVAASGSVQALMNCAGIAGRTGLPAHEVSLDDFDRVCRVNLHGALVASQAVLPPMLAAGYGRILHVASIAGKEGNAGALAYSATKAGLIGMVKAMAKDYAQTGITVNALAPAVIPTPLVAHLSAERLAAMVAKVPMGRPGTLTEAARMAAFILSPACSFTTGFAFDLSGGRATY